MIIMYDIPGIPDRCDCTKRAYGHAHHVPGCAATLPPPPPPPASGRQPAECICEPGYVIDSRTGHAPRCPLGPYGTPEPAPDDPPAEWLMVWVSGYLGGYATGYDHGHEDGEREYGESLAEALTPMRRAAAHGIDVALARGAWQQHQQRMGGAA